VRSIRSAAPSTRWRPAHLEQFADERKSSGRATDRHTALAHERLRAAGSLAGLETCSRGFSASDSSSMPAAVCSQFDDPVVEVDEARRRDDRPALRPREPGLERS